MVTKRETPEQTSQADGGRARLLLLDGHSMAFRAFFALPVEKFGTSTGQSTNAVYGFASMLVKLLRDEEPTHVAVAWDLSGPTFRDEEYDGYKGGRSETPPEFPSQVPLTQDLMRLIGVANLSAPGFEADDVIATLAHQGCEAGMEVLIASGDRDAFQLVNEDCTVLYPGKSLSDMRRMDPEAVEDKYGVTPERYRDLAALVGEKADNLPGVPGVGPKTAAKWITKFGSLEELVARADEVPGKAGQNFRDHLDDVLRNQRLNKLVTDVELDTAVRDLGLGEADRAGVDALFDNLEFASNLRERLYAVIRADDGEESAEAGGAVEGFTVDVTVAATGGVAAWITEHASAESLTDQAPAGLAVDGTWGAGTGRVDALAVTVPGGASLYVDPTVLDTADTEALAAFLADAGRPKAVHEYKGALLALGAHGWDLNGVVSDTALAAYLAQPGQRRFDLADLCRKYLGRELEVDTDGDQMALDLGEQGGSGRGHGLAVRAAATRDLAAVLVAELDKRGGTHLLHEVELPLVDVLARLERAGIAADREYLEGLQGEFASAARGAVERAHEIVGREFNLGSPKQLQQVLFEDLELPRTKKIKTGFTTDADALAWLAARTENELPGVLLHHRDQTKLRTTVEGLIKTVADDGRIHTTFNQTVAATGRLSSTEPNLQNIPVRTDVGRRIRRAFVVGEGYEELLTADYSQIELRIMAHLSGERALIDAFNSGYDFHAHMAAQVFDIEVGEVDGEARSKIKAMSYGLAYGLSAYGLSQQLAITPEEAKRLMEDYFASFGGVRDYLNQVVDEARKVGYTETILGRRRYLPDLTSDNRQRREMAERMALNAPIQGSAADIIKVAMLQVDAALTEGGFRSRVLLQVHDELVVEVSPGEREAVENLVTHEMGSAYDLRVPLGVSVGSGQNWHDAAH
ncbi:MULTISPECIES: DNA polymerase I [unclassified Nocardiopsis]|uniref:DNA polymerase I n=1 Tax=unclassified Nocardiopsis TaxID=2649073 RepID=UPI00066CF572|nr:MULTISPECIES: DNA polymerase I [unclassified Nocardiopsis]MBQ1082749.1 DNA polymerase I [Nocardiopsis sp. B62]